MRVAINGLGRMGRLALRAGWERDGVEFTHVNEIAGGIESAAHLLEFDSVHGRWGRDIRHEADEIEIDGTTIGFGSVSDPSGVDWTGADVVLECTGAHRTMEALRPYLAGGTRKVVVAAPVKDPAALNVVVGVNDDPAEIATHEVLTAASCTTNCLAPIVKVIHEAIGIRHGSITTLHDMTNTQRVVDAPHKDLRRARAASQSLIPTTTGSATAIGLIFPGLQGRLDGIAIRVPLLNASLTDCVFEVTRPTSVDEVNGLLAGAADGAMAGVLGYETRPLVSVDYRTDPRSSIVDGPSTKVVNGTQVKILAWYDNEWAYANRLIDLAVAAGESLPGP